MTIAEIRRELDRLERVTPLEGEHYAACLETYEGASNQREEIVSWLVEDVIAELPTDRLSVLSVGCGDGRLDSKILAASAVQASAIQYVGLEPEPPQCDRFIAGMEAAATGNARVEVLNVPFEECSEARRFDLVLMVHSLYYMQDPEVALKAALKLVREGGYLVVLIARKDTLNELSASIWNLENERPTWFSQDLQDYLRRRGIRFACQRIEATLDLTACCERDSERGIQIADFLAQVSTGELPAHLRQLIFRYLDETAHRDGNTRWLPHNVDAFTIEA